MKFCKCGNALAELPFKMVIHPCRCSVKGGANHTAPDLDRIGNISERQYEQRTRVGLPIEADVEKSARIPWH